MLIARSLRGMNDLFEPELLIWRQIEKAITEVCHSFGYKEIRTPILEELALFKRGIGEGTDIVEKEMFLVPDSEHTYCLRPENTASVVRALIERGGIGEDTLEKLYYVGPMFRKERPQKGRLRQFHQLGVELFGVAEPSADVEIIVMMDQLFKVLGLKGVELKINTLGQADERVHYKAQLKEFLIAHRSVFCKDCNKRIDTNPLRVLDCKDESCQKVVKDAPPIMDSLGQRSKEHFHQVLHGLTHQKIAFSKDHRLVRGLDYYNRTVFEFSADSGLGAQNAVAGGGRYDGLFKTLGSKMDLPAIGCSAGIERIVLLLKEDQSPTMAGIELALVYADESGQRLSMDLAFALRKLGIAADFSLIKKSIKAQMRRADKSNARFVVVLGEEEQKKNTVMLKDMASQNSHEVALNAKAIAAFLTSL